MQRTVTALVAALAVAITSPARPVAAAGPFADVPLTAPPKRSYKLAWLAAATGVGSIGASFVFSGRGNATYDEYLVESDPDQIERLWDRTILNDRLSSGLLLGGEAMIAVSIYLAFLRDVPASQGPLSDAGATSRRPVALTLGPGRCALAWRF